MSTELSQRQQEQRGERSDRSNVRTLSLSITDKRGNKRTLTWATGSDSLRELGAELGLALGELVKQERGNGR